MKNKKIKALLSKTVAVGIAASMVTSLPVMADSETQGETKAKTPTASTSLLGGVNEQPSSGEGSEIQRDNSQEESNIIKEKTTDEQKDIQQVADNKEHDGFVEEEKPVAEVTADDQKFASELSQSDTSMTTNDQSDVQNKEQQDAQEKKAVSEEANALDSDKKENNNQIKENGTNEITVEKKIGGSKAQNDDGVVWVDSGTKGTVRPDKADDQERSILYGKVNDSILTNSAGKPVEILSTNKHRETPQSVERVSIDGVGQEAPTKQHKDYDDKAEYISKITGGVCDDAWISPQNILLYTKDDPKGKFKAGDKIVYEKDGKKYNLYFTDDNHGQRNGYDDTALVIPEEDTVDNESEGLHIAMVDWSGATGNNVSAQSPTSTQEQYIRQLIDPKYRNGERKQLTYNQERDKGRKVVFTEGSGGSDYPQDAILVDNAKNSYLILSPNDDITNGKDVPLYYYSDGQEKYYTVKKLTGKNVVDNCYGNAEWKTAQEIASDKSLIVVLTGDSEDVNKTVKNTPVEYVTGESGVFSDTLGKDGYPTISEQYDRSRTDNKTSEPTSLGELFDYNKNKQKFEKKVDTKTYAPHFGMDTSVGNWDSYFLTNGLLQTDSDGYWSFDSNKNFASLAPAGYEIYDTLKEGTSNQYVTSAQNGSTLQFMLFDETGTPKLYNQQDRGSQNEDYRVGNFLPYDTLNLAQKDKQSKNNQYEVTKSDAPDYLFGMETGAKFVQTPDGKVNGNDMIYQFSGDDDMVVYIDGRLALDLSGVHDALNGTINFADGTVTTQKNITNAIADMRFTNVIKQDKSQYATKTFRELGFDNLNEKGTFKDGSLHDIKIFYMERGRGASNLNMKLNLSTAPVNTVTSSVKKTWNDGSKTHATDHVTMRLKESRDGGKTWVNSNQDLDPLTDGVQTEIQLNDKNNWSYSVRKLPRYTSSNGTNTEIKYKWVEDNVSGYSTSSQESDDEDKEGKGILSQFFDFVNTLLGNSTATQEWKDADNKFSTRPDTVRMTLKSSTDGENWEIGDYDVDPEQEGNQSTITLGKNNQWSYTVENLPKYDKDGKEIFYKWFDDDSNKKTGNGYATSEVTTPTDFSLNQTYTVTNKLWAVSSAIKDWDDAQNKDGIRPESIKLTLHRINADGTETNIKTVDVKPDASGHWAVSQAVPRVDDNGAELQYYWTEDDVSEYKQSKYKKDENDDHSVNERTTITNQHTPKADPQATPSEPVKPQPDPDSESGQPEVNPTTPSDGTNNTQSDSNNASKEKPEQKPTNDSSASDEKKSETPANKTDVKPTAVSPQKTVAKSQITVKPAATVNSTAKTSVTKTSTAKTTDEVKTADEGHTGRNAAAMTLSAAMLGLAAMFTRKRKQNHNR